MAELEPTGNAQPTNQPANRSRALFFPTLYLFVLHILFLSLFVNTKTHTFTHTDTHTHTVVIFKQQNHSRPPMPSLSLSSSRFAHLCALFARSHPPLDSIFFFFLDASIEFNWAHISSECSLHCTALFLLVFSHVPWDSRIFFSSLRLKHFGRPPIVPCICLVCTRTCHVKGKKGTICTDLWGLGRVDRSPRRSR